jgi:phi13 family phage major tail protein
MGDRIALDGFADARYWPITTNSSTTYATGTMAQFVGARNLTKSDNAGEYTILGDNRIYATGKKFKYQDMEFEVNELSLEMLAQLQGYTYDAGTKSYKRARTDQAIEIAFAYSAPLFDGGFRMWKHYCCTVMEVKVDHKTADPDNPDAQTYKITIRNTYRLADDLIEWVQDDAEDVDWLGSIDQLPVEGGGGT